jgi:hypothetical protein
MFGVPPEARDEWLLFPLGIPQRSLKTTKRLWVGFALGTERLEQLAGRRKSRNSVRNGVPCYAMKLVQLPRWQHSVLDEMTESQWKTIAAERAFTDSKRFITPASSLDISDKPCSHSPPPLLAPTVFETTLRQFPLKNTSH